MIPELALMSEVTVDICVQYSNSPAKEQNETTYKTTLKIKGV